MYKEKSVAVIIPCFNEGKNVRGVIDSVPKFVDNIVVVDDKSSDDTYKIAVSSGDKRVVVVKHEANRGAGASVVSGFKRALELNADICAVMDGDGQMDPTYLPSLLDTLITGGYDYAKGNRFLRKDYLTGMPRHRIVGNMILTFLTKLASGYWDIFDPQNGYIAAKAEVLREIELEGVARGYEFHNDILINLNIHDYRVKDVPMPAVYKTERSTIKLTRFIPRTSFYLLKGLGRRIIQKYMLRDFHPIALFLLSGFSALALSLVYGSYIFIKTLGPPIAVTADVLIIALSFVIGFILLLTSLVLDMLNNPNL